jgi:hypothetical protein
VQVDQPAVGRLAAVRAAVRASTVQTAASTPSIQFNTLTCVDDAQVDQAAVERLAAAGALSRVPPLLLASIKRAALGPGSVFSLEEAEGRAKEVGLGD